MKTDKKLVNYVLEQIEELEVFLTGIDDEYFLRDNILKNACLMKLIVIGEYLSKASGSLKERFSDIEWQRLKAARNYYIHAYGGVTWIRIWETLSESLPVLKRKLQDIQAEIG